jgi:hypothetical protein
MIAIALVVVALVVVAVVVVWWIFFKKDPTTTTEAAKKKPGEPAQPPEGCMVQGLNTCTNKFTLISEKATATQSKDFQLHNDCCANSACTETHVVAGPGAHTGIDQKIEFKYASEKKAYEILMTGCDTLYRLCAFQNGISNNKQKALWLKASEPTTGPAATTDKDWTTGARSCFWQVEKSGNGVHIKVPPSAATTALKGQYLSFDSNDYWANAGGIYYAPGILINSPANATWILKFPVAK